MHGFRPLHDRLLVKRVEAEEKTPGGIIIPDTAKEKPIEGEVLAVGAGRRDETGKVQPLDVNVGDRLLFGKWSGTDGIIDGEDRLIMNEADVFGVIERTVARRSRPHRGRFMCNRYRERPPQLPQQGDGTTSPVRIELILL